MVAPATRLPSPDPEQPLSHTGGPQLGARVLYVSENADGVVSPADVLRTRATTVPGLVDGWSPDGAGTLSGAGRPNTFEPVLPDDTTVDLLVLGLGGNYRRFAVPAGDADEPGTWHPMPARGCRCRR